MFDGDTKVESLASTCFTGTYSKAEVEPLEGASASGDYEWKCD